MDTDTVKVFSYWLGEQIKVWNRLRATHDSFKWFRCNPLIKRYFYKNYVKRRLSEVILADNYVQRFQCGKRLTRKRHKYIMIVLECGFPL